MLAFNNTIFITFDKLCNLSSSFFSSNYKYDLKTALNDLQLL